MLWPTYDLEDTVRAPSPSKELKEPTPQDAMDLTSHVAFWGKESTTSCLCGASPGSYCSCLSMSIDFTPENDYFEQPPTQKLVVSQPSTHFPSTILTPRGFTTGKPPNPTRKEVSIGLARWFPFTSLSSKLTQTSQRRRQQNRAAQVRHRDKRNRFLHDTLINIESLHEELKQTRAQRDYFRLMCAGLEGEVVLLRSQASSRVPSHSPGGG